MRHGLVAERLVPRARVSSRLADRAAKSVCINAFERTYVTALLERVGANVGSDARNALVNRVYLHRLLSRQGLR